MDYELAEELHKTGFKPKNVTIAGSILAIQTTSLSELIDACGKNFPKLSNEYGEWECGEMEYCCGEHGYSWETITLGKTPEEAVAKLWLVLNK